MLFGSSSNENRSANHTHKIASQWTGFQLLSILDFYIALRRRSFAS
jgi:hypothetical protein